MGRQSGFLKIVALFGFFFLYAPIVSLVIFSFNESKLVTVWGGFSTRWYAELFRDPQILEAAWVSIKIALISATLAIIIGTIGSFVLIRFKKFRSKGLLSMMITAPLVMPEVIIGLSLLLLFVAMQGLVGWPGGRGML
ncbi:MAG: putrescine ABC transporter permease PotI, partial [Rhodobacteraceae bacterium]|nr:putrescine ABC transporter permease PotI [Paracoccaceae bacterium]